MTGTGFDGGAERSVPRFGGRVAGFLLALGLALSLQDASRLAAQWPGELAGRVTDSTTGEPIQAAAVSLADLGVSTLTDPTGAFLLRGLESGSHTVRIRRLGYAPLEESVRVRNGQTSRLNVELRPDAVVLEGVQAAPGPRSGGPGVIRIDRSEVVAAGSRTAGDAVARVPGVVLLGRGAGQEQKVSIRGSAADAVLVLVDGVPINDPVTGEADLSTIPAHLIERITVEVGARGARHGPRAEAGAILIETRSPVARLTARAAAGSLGERGVGGEWGWRSAGMRWTVGTELRSLDGGFVHPRVPGTDERPVQRTNADLDEWSVWGAGQGSVFGGDLRLRLGIESLERGLPGRGFAPSIAARQELERIRGSVSWRRTGEKSVSAISLAGSTQQTRYADPAPPSGLPYDETVDVDIVELRTETQRAGPVRWLESYGAGLEVSAQHVNAGALAEGAPRTRADLGAFTHGTVRHVVSGWRLSLSGQGRVDRDDVANRWFASRSATLAVDRGSGRLYLANRSSFSPPSLGDQFFRGGVGVAPNPDLQPVRVPSEWEVGASAESAVGPLDLRAGGSAYQGDVRGMIVWMPDFRFIWSPRNTDVLRRGADLWAELELRPHALTFSGTYSLTRVTYDRAGAADDAVQVIYRPRHSAHFGASWTPAHWAVRLDARYTGGRYPVPAPINRLPGFWAADLSLRRDWALGGWSLATALRVDRLFDQKDSLIFAFPEPGRRFRLDVQARPGKTP